MAVFTSAGTRLYIGDAPVTYNQAGFEAVVWVEIGEVTDAGEFGREYNLVTHNPLANRRTVKRRGSYNDGALQLQMARVPDDAGQAEIVDRLNSDVSSAVKVVLQDGTTQYFTAQVMSYTTNVGGVDQITAASTTLEIDNDILEVAAP